MYKTFPEKEYAVCAPQEEEERHLQPDNKGANIKSPPLLALSPSPPLQDAVPIQHAKEEYQQPDSRRTFSNSGSDHHVTCNSFSPPPDLPSLKSSLTEHLTVSQLRRKICDNGDIKQQQQDKRVLILCKKLNISFHFLSPFVELCTSFYLVI